MPSQQAALIRPGSAHAASDRNTLSVYSSCLFCSLLLTTLVHALPPLPHPPGLQCVAGFFLIHLAYHVLGPVFVDLNPNSPFSTLPVNRPLQAKRCVFWSLPPALQGQHNLRKSLVQTSSTSCLQGCSLDLDISRAKQIHFSGST